MASTDGQGRPALSLVRKDRAAAFYAELCARQGGPVLVLGSAKGAVAWDLASRGFDVVAVEPSVRMLELAQARRSDERPEVAARLRFVEADVRSVRLERTFATVLAPHNAFGLLSSFEDLEDFLATARVHLAAEGAFAFDLTVPPLEPSTVAAQGGAAVKQKAPRMEPPRPVFVPHLRHRRTANTAGLHRLRLRQFTLGELDAALDDAGLQATERYGNFEGRPFDASDTLAVVVALSS